MPVSLRPICQHIANLALAAMYGSMASMRWRMTDSDAIPSGMHRIGGYQLKTIETGIRFSIPVANL